MDSASQAVPKKLAPEPESGQSFFDAEEVLETQLGAALSKTAGIFTVQDLPTLEIAFDLMDQLIALYHLERLDELIQQVLPVVTNTGVPKMYARAIQMKAFLRYKQFKYAECLKYFKEFGELEGTSTELFENMAHAHNALGQLDEAEAMFENALSCSKRKGGILLGLGALASKRGNYETSLKHQRAALEVWQLESGHTDSSLCAKSMTGIAQSLVYLGRTEEARVTLVEAVRVFTVTCTEDSPLTANAIHDLASVLVTLGKLEEAQVQILHSLRLHVQFDTLNRKALAELMQLAVELVKGPEAAKKYIRPFNTCLDAIVTQQVEVDDNLAVYLKYAGQVAFIAHKYPLATRMLVMAKAHLVSVVEPDCTSLIATCDLLIDFMRKNN